MMNIMTVSFAEKTQRLQSRRFREFRKW